jgi:hypothetical protein
MKARRRWTAASLVLALAAGAQVAAASGRAQAITCDYSAQDGSSASSIARTCGIRVEVLAARTESSQVYAEPSGTFTEETTAMPVRVRRPDGSWAATDPTLVRQPDGSVLPRATTAAVRLSGGGSEPLVKIEQGGTPWALSWPSPLPPPTLAGNTATYPEVLPGVDLLVRATVDGFSHLLVVKSAQAAANPQLGAITYRLGGASATATLDGGVVITAPDGSTLVSAASVDMWDSTPAPAVEEAFESSPDGPGSGARQARMEVKASGSDLTVVPDAALLTGPGTVYPVYLDPAFTVGMTRWAYANNTNTNNSDGKAWVGEDPVNLNRYRSFFDFNVSSLRGKHIISASLEAKLYHSWSCESTPVYLYRTNAITRTPRAIWSSMSLSRYLDVRSAHAHKGASACGNQPDVVMWFNGNLTGDLQAAATGNSTQYSVGFCACSSSSGSGETMTERWKKFYPSTVKLHATYNSYPATPSALATTPASSCVSGASRPAINTWTPQLRTTLTDVDGGATLRADFAYSVNGGTSWTAMPRTGGQASGLPHTVTLPDLSSGAPPFISWRVRAWDGTDFSKLWSATCEFTVDTTPPASPVLQPGDALPPYPINPPPIVVVGTPVAVPVTSGGSSDVTGYWYAVGSSTISPPRQTYVAADTVGNATLQVTPVVSGLSANWLTLQSVDRAGNFSAEVTYSFRSNPAS